MRPSLVATLATTLLGKTSAAAGASHQTSRATPLFRAAGITPARRWVLQVPSPRATQAPTHRQLPNAASASRRAMATSDAGDGTTDSPAGEEETAVERLTREKKECRKATRATLKALSEGDMREQSAAISGRVFW